MLSVGEDIGEHLTRMMLIGEAVDHWHTRVRCEALDDLLAEGADHDDVAHAGHHLRGIFHRFATAELAVARVEIDRCAAELVHAGLEREPGTGRVFFEHHHQRAVEQRMVGLVVFELALDELRAFEQVGVLREREVGKRQIVSDCHK